MYYLLILYINKSDMCSLHLEATAFSDLGNCSTSVCSFPLLCVLLLSTKRCYCLFLILFGMSYSTSIIFSAFGSRQWFGIFHHSGWDLLLIILMRCPFFPCTGHCKFYSEVSSQLGTHPWTMILLMRQAVQM